jgi:hypothetical protein
LKMGYEYIYNSGKDPAYKKYWIRSNRSVNSQFLLTSIEKSIIN